MQPVVFVSYSHKDKDLKDELVKHLGVLKTAGLIDIWSDDKIEPGADWQAETKEALNHARIAVLIVTANSLNSEFILKQMIPEISDHESDGRLIFLPIIAKHCAWKSHSWLKKHPHIRPKNYDTPVWSHNGNQVDKNLSEIAEEIVQIIEKGERDLPTPPDHIVQKGAFFVSFPPQKRQVSKTITLETAFNSTPVVVVSPICKQSCNSYLRNVTTTSFEIAIEVDSSYTDNIPVNWIAINKSIQGFPS